MSESSQGKKDKRTILPNDIDWNKVDDLLKCGCTLSEVSGRIGIPTYSLQRAIEAVKGKSFAEYKTEKMDTGNSYIREVQFKLAVIEKDKTMLLWLGRNRLGQSEAPPQEEQFSGELKEFIMQMKEKFKEDASCKT